jgi:transcriptional regulator with XRE-family HTH domain
MKQLREKHGYTQKEFSELLDVSISTVQSWEQGTRSVGRRSMKDIKKAFPTAAEVDEILGDKNIYKYLQSIVNGEQS